MENIKGKLFYIVFTLSIMTCITSYSQTYNGLGSRWYGGGAFGISFGNATSISIMPELAYAVTDDFFVGAGIRYTYYRENYGTNYESTIWGGKLFARYFLFNDFFVHLEAERLYFKDPYYISPIGGDSWIHFDYFYGGVGYRQWMGERSFMTLALLFDLTSNDYSFGSNPFIRFGFGVGF